MIKAFKEHLTVNTKGKSMNVTNGKYARSAIWSLYAKYLGEYDVRLLLYVDDIISTAKSPQGLQEHLYIVDDFATRWNAS